MSTHELTCIFSGTLFLELWKRKTSTLAYEWDVDEFEATEPDRPEFYGTKAREVRKKLKKIFNSYPNTGTTNAVNHFSINFPRAE